MALRRTCKSCGHDKSTHQTRPEDPGPCQLYVGMSACPCTEYIQPKYRERITRVKLVNTVIQVRRTSSGWQAYETVNGREIWNGPHYEVESHANTNAINREQGKL